MHHTHKPGSGKSTFLRYLALRMAEAREHDESRFFALLLQCKNWTDRDADIGVWVSQQARVTYGLLPTVTTHWLSRVSALLLLDSIDDVPLRAWETLTTQLNIWMNSAVGGGLILTCRPDSYVAAFSRISHDQVATLEPLGHSAIHDPAWCQRQAASRRARA